MAASCDCRIEGKNKMAMTTTPSHLGSRRSASPSMSTWRGKAAACFRGPTEAERCSSSEVLRSSQTERLPRASMVQLASIHATSKAWDCGTFQKGEGTIRAAAVSAVIAATVCPRAQHDKERRRCIVTITVSWRQKGTCENTRPRRNKVVWNDLGRRVIRTTSKILHRKKHGKITVPDKGTCNYGKHMDEVCVRLGTYRLH